MYEKAKIEEAEYFLSQMRLNKQDPKPFHHNLSAFLAASRSVLQYAHKDAKERAGGPKWYRSQMKNSRVLTFFKDKRDINIHEQPIKAKQKIAVVIEERIYVSDALRVILKQKNGKVIGQYDSGEKMTAPNHNVSPPSATYEYFFSDWLGEDDVITLCQQCLDEVKVLVGDGITKGHICAD